MKKEISTEEATDFFSNLAAPKPTQNPVLKPTTSLPVQMKQEKPAFSADEATSFFDQFSQPPPAKFDNKTQAKPQMPAKPIPASKVIPKAMFD